jgi:hypothetical protein
MNPIDVFVAWTPVSVAALALFLLLVTISAVLVYVFRAQVGAWFSARWNENSTAHARTVAWSSTLTYIGGRIGLTPPVPWQATGLLWLTAAAMFIKADANSSASKPAVAGAPAAIAILLMLGASIGLSACSTPAAINPPVSTAPASPPAPKVTLQQAQNAATILYTNLKAQVSAYEQNATLDPQTQADLDQSVKDLGVLVANFAALPAGASWVNDAEALLNVGQAIVNNLPAGMLNPNAKAAVDSAIALLQSALVLLPPSALTLAPGTYQAPGTVLPLQAQGAGPL